MILLLQLAVIVAVARVAGCASLRLGQPAVIGEIASGLLLGPSCFGWLAPDVSARLFAPATLPTLNALSQVGLVLFMFLVGLRLGAERVEVCRRKAVVISATSIAVPFGLGTWLASAVHERLAPEGIGLLPFALFIGAAMSVTAFPVLARILIDRRLLTTEVGVVAIASAACDDVAGWLILGGVLALVGAGDIHLVVTKAVLFIGYLAVMIVILRPTLRRFARWRGPGFGVSANDLAVVLVVLFLSAVTTELLGVHALFGAFFAGWMMPRDTHLEQFFSERAEPITMTLLLPVFFVFTGLRTDVQLIDSVSLWRDAVLVLTVAVIGKAGASALASRAMGFRWREATALGVLLNTRGLIELVVLNIGLELRILSPVVFSIMVLMALVTTFMTSPVIAWLLPTPRTTAVLPTVVLSRTT